jgi:hypothetical protein
MVNLIEIVQSRLSLPPLEKIDPNLQEIKQFGRARPAARLAQASVPAVLAAIYKLTRSDEGCAALLNKPVSIDWLTLIWAGNAEAAGKKIAGYAGVALADASRTMHTVAAEAIDLLLKHAGHQPRPESIRALMDTQRHHILVYLPAALQIGEVLGDEALDDRTNKMEGPLSGFMHKIETVLSKGDMSKYP